MSSVTIIMTQQGALR